jgi:acetoin utilization deacetylase AcuC-like enzyme
VSPSVNIYYSQEYALATGLETVTKSAEVAAAIVADPALAVRLVAPAPATREELRAVHEDRYLRTVFAAGPGELPTGPRTPALRRSLLASTGGMRDAVAEALRAGRSGSLSSGLHHARRGAGEGFCTLNGLALGALRALRDVASVGILDLDAHFGGGTFEILGEHPQVRLADVSVNGYDRWEPSAPARHHVELVADPAAYLDAVSRALRTLEGVRCLLYNAGMDVHERAGGLKGLTTEIVRRREALVFGWARGRGIPIAFALAGGYRWGGLTLAQVAALHLETVRACATD